MIVEFERHLRGTNLAENTVKSYLFAVRQFYTRYDSVTKRSLKEHILPVLLVMQHAGNIRK
jgi:integrase/recombinase XerD